MKSHIHKEAFEAYLISKTQSYFEEKNQLNEAIQYSLLAPGKRIRPLLCIGFSQGFGGDVEMARACGMAIEMIHAYSLIHDDLPAMDNDDYRRGRLTNHKVFGEAIAILAGDSLITFAPEFLLLELAKLKITPTLILELIKLMLHSSGPEGMVKGQAMDMKYEAEDLSGHDKKTLESILKNIHKLKTGAIITWSCIAGLYTSSETKTIEENKCMIESMGQRIGLLFQMVDDILDVTSTLKDLGKTPGKDEKAGKLTYTNLNGLEGASAIATELVKDIQKDLGELKIKHGGDWELIEEIIDSLQTKIPSASTP